MPGSCKNHDLILAHKRCYHCKEWICPKCTTRIFHHLFCSTRCIIFFRLSETAAFLKLLFTSPQKAFKRKGSRFVKSPYLERFLIVFIFFLNVVLINDMKDDRNLLENRVVNLKSELELLNEEQKKMVIEKMERMNRLSPVITGGLKSKVDNKRITISGEGGNGRIINLYLNRELRHTIVSNSGEFKFEDVGLIPGENEIEIRSVDDRGVDEVIKVYKVYYSSEDLETTGSNFTRGARGNKMIALTFDGGASDTFTDEILDILNNKGIKSTFFLTGKFIKKFPGPVRRMVEEGHEVGNHTYSHPHLTTFEINMRHDTRPGISYSVFQSELLKADSLFYKATGRRLARLWRSPYGEQNEQIRFWAAELGYQHIGWTTGDVNGENMDSHDWVSDKGSHLYKTAEEIKNRLLSFGLNDPDGANGAVILMHLGSSRTDDQVYEILPELIDTFMDMDYEFCRVSELIWKKSETGYRD